MAGHRDEKTRRSMPKTRPKAKAMSGTWTTTSRSGKTARIRHRTIPGNDAVPARIATADTGKVPASYAGPCCLSGEKTSGDKTGTTIFTQMEATATKNRETKQHDGHRDPRTRASQGKPVKAARNPETSHIRNDRYPKRRTASRPKAGKADSVR